MWFRTVSSIPESVRPHVRVLGCRAVGRCFCRHSPNRPQAAKTRQLISCRTESFRVAARKAKSCDEVSGVSLGLALGIHVLFRSCGTSEELLTVLAFEVFSEREDFNRAVSSSTGRREAAFGCFDGAQLRTTTTFLECRVRGVEAATKGLPILDLQVAG